MCVVRLQYLSGGGSALFIAWLSVAWLGGIRLRSKTVVWGGVPFFPTQHVEAEVLGHVFWTPGFLRALQLRGLAKAAESRLESREGVY